MLLEPNASFNTSLCACVLHQHRGAQGKLGCTRAGFDQRSSAGSGFQLHGPSPVNSDLSLANADLAISNQKVTK
jgi:hypothetical protein